MFSLLSSLLNSVSKRKKLGHTCSDHRPIEDLVWGHGQLLSFNDWRQHNNGIHLLQWGSQVREDLPLLSVWLQERMSVLVPASRVTTISASQRTEILLSIINPWQSHKIAVFFCSMHVNKQTTCVEEGACEKICIDGTFNVHATNAAV